MKYPKLKGKRAELGITQEEMAKKLGMTPTTYSFKETGKREFVASEILQILQILDSKYEDIFLN